MRGPAASFVHCVAPRVPAVAAPVRAVVVVTAADRVHVARRMAALGHFAGLALGSWLLTARCNLQVDLPAVP